MEYYYTDGFTNFGPFTLEQLKEKHITPSTRIWYTGLGGWTPASDIPELAGILVAEAPPVSPPVQPAATAPGYTRPVNMTRPPKTWLVESILVTLFCCLPFGIAGIIHAGRVESRFYAGDIQGSIESSNEAGRWTKIGFWTGLIVTILYFIFIFGVKSWSTQNGINIENFTPGI